MPDRVAAAAEVPGLHPLTRARGLRPVMEVKDHPSELMIERAMRPLAQIVRGAAVDAPESAREAGAYYSAGTRRQRC